MDTAQSRRQAREQQQRKNTRKWIATGAAAVVLLSGGVVAVNHFGAGDEESSKSTAKSIPQECSTTQSVTVETTDVMASVLQQVPVDPETCITLDVTTGKSANEVVAAVAGSSSATANLWIPDSSLRAELAMSQADASLTPVAESLAQTAGVLISNPDAATFSSWTDVLLDTEQVAMGDPKTDSGAFAALMSGVAEASEGTSSTEKLSEGTGQRATTIGVEEPAPTAEQLLEQVENGDTTTGVVTEAAYVRYTAEHEDTAVKASLPATGSDVLNYPMYRTSSNNNSTIDAAAGQITSFMNSEEGKAALKEAGMRPSGKDALADANAGPLGAITQLTPSDPKVLGQIWGSYALQSAPFNALVVLDASGSMLTPVEGSDKTRMDLTVESVLAGSQLFPARDSMGLWKFSRNIQASDGSVSDWVELVPSRGFEESVDGKTQRQLLQEAGSTIAADIDPNGKTALNDTLLAAFRSVKEGYEPGAANAVVMLTDGENWDEGSISQEDLIKTIQAEQDPNNPVFIILIGISDDADMEALSTIATSVGGEAYPATSPEDIQQIFGEGLTQVASKQADAAETSR